MQHHYNVAILGAGLGGLGMAMRLLSDGESNFVVLEKSDRVGGTWRDNTYPGASCDIRSHLYWFSFDEQPDWSRVFAFQPEIQANIERLAARHGLDQYIRFHAEVKSATWHDGRGHWHIRMADGTELTARSFITAWGQLNRPSYGSITGRENFRGPSFHSAQWDHDVELKGKRVGVIGNGASAVQFIPEIAPEVAHLTVFQRTANYCIPRDDRPYEPTERQDYLTKPELLMASRDQIFAEQEGWFGAMRQNTDGAREFTEIARAHLESQVADPVLREKLWPDYPIGCKRMLVASNFYPAMCRPNVELVTEGIAGVEATGVRMKDGTLHEFDVLIYGTGFETQSFLGSIEITGHDGLTLREAWHDVPMAYLGISIAGFPNMFMLYGPNTNLGHNSIITMLEAQFGYVMQGLHAIAELGAAIDIRRDVMIEYNRTLQEELKGSSFAGSCKSWYKTADGRITNNWSGTVEDYRARVRHFVLSEYEVLAEEKV